MQNRNHTSKRFEGELKALRDGLLAMGQRAEQQLARAVEAIVGSDAQLVQQVIGDDFRIDQDELNLDEVAFLILARRQPVASDLRLVMLALKIVTDLERIGDLAVNIAKRARELSRSPLPPRFHEEIRQLAAEVGKALHGALESFAAADAEQAERVIHGDGAIDALNQKLISDILALGAREEQEVARALALSSVSRYLERAGDHATNIAEMVIYYVRGRDVRHDRGQRS